MNVAVKIDPPEDRSTQNDSEICERLTETEPLQNNNNNVIENQVTTFKSSRGILAQCIVTIVIGIGTIGAGMPIGYSAVLLPQLKSPNETLRIDDDMGSWIASIHSAATPIGSLLSGTMMDYFGRKLSLQIACIPLILGWTLISISPSHAVILIGRICAGLCVGLVAPAGQVYLAEISDARMRGFFSSVPFSSYSFGILLVYMLGSYLQWRLVSALCVILPGSALILYFFLPESPAWLVQKGKIEEARKACLWLRGGNVTQTKQEIQQLINRAENEKSLKENKQSVWKYFFTPQVLKPFFIINIFNLLQTFAGVYLIVFYAVDIISNMGGQDINKFFAAVLTAGVRFIFAMVSSFMLAVTGRRVVGIGSAISTGISALCLAMFLHSDCPKNSYFAAICLLFYVASNTVGLLILPGVMVGELYPIRVRGIAGALTFTFLNLMIFGITKLFPFLQTFLTIDEFFVMFGVSALITAVYIYCVVPETRGKTLNEIEDYFLQENVLWITRNKRSKEIICQNNNVKII